MVWVHAGGRKKPPRILRGEIGGIYIALVTAARDDDTRDPRIRGTLYDVPAVSLETVVGKIGTDVDQRVWHRHVPARIRAGIRVDCNRLRASGI